MARFDCARHGLRVPAVLPALADYFSGINIQQLMSEWRHCATINPAIK